MSTTRSAWPPNTLVWLDRGHLEDHREQQQQPDADEGQGARITARAVSGSAAACSLARPAGEHLDDVEAAQVGEGLDVHALVLLELVEVDLASPCRSGSRAGTATRPCVEVNPDVTTVVSSVTRRSPSIRSSRRSLGLPTCGRTTPLAPAGITWAVTALDASVISRDLRGAAGDLR